MTLLVVMVWALGVYSDFGSALGIIPPSISEKDLANSACKEGITNYRTGISRALRLLELPGISGWFAMAFEEECEKHAKEMLGDNLSKEAVTPLIHQIRIRGAWRIGERFANWSPEDERVKTAFINALDMVSHAPPNEMWEKNRILGRPIRALLESVVIQAWSAFEILTSDLCLKAVASRVSLSLPTKKERQKERLGFSSRNAVRKMYEFVFKADTSDMQFALSGDEVDAPALIRNLFVHSGGIIDADFMDGSALITMLNPWRSKGIGTRIELDGKMVKELVGGLIPKGCELAVAVDNWLNYHP